MFNSYFHDLETQLEYKRKEVEELKKQIALLRNALEQMDLQICAAGDLMTKEDMQEADRLTALRDSVLEQTKD